MYELAVIFIIAGTILLVTEMFIPGFGVAGILGLLSLFAAVLLQIGNPYGMLFMAALTLFITSVAVILFFRIVSKGKLDKSRIVLNDRIEGYSTEVGDNTIKSFKGRAGLTITPLRPAGKAVFGDTTLDVVTSGEFLPGGADVEIVEIDSLRVLVRVIPEHMPIDHTRENAEETQDASL